MNRLSIKLLGLLGSILGITALGCGGAPTYGPQPLYGAQPVYGMPYAEYRLSGKVVDSTSGDPIPAISLSFEGKTTTSATDGTWSLDVTNAVYCNSVCELQASDVDGAASGAYTDASVALAPTQVSAGSGTWNEGIFEQKDIQVSLDPKP